MIGNKFQSKFQLKNILLNPFPIRLSLLNFSQNQQMIQSPFLQQVHLCKGVMKKLRKKIYKFNINKQTKTKRVQTTIRDAIDVLGKRNIPLFLLEELQKYSDLTFSSLSGFSLGQVTPLEDISNLTNMQEKQISDIYHKNKKNIKRRRSVYSVLKLDKRPTSAEDQIESPVSYTSIDDQFQDQQNDSEYDSNEQSNLFEPIANSNSFDQDFNNSDAMFQSTMLDFGNQIDMDSEQFLFKC